MELLSGATHICIVLTYNLFLFKYLVNLSSFLVWHCSRGPPANRSKPAGKEV